MVADIDTGEEIKARIDDLMKLLSAFREGIISRTPPRQSSPSPDERQGLSTLSI